MKASLEISLLGGFAVARAGRLIHDFESDKARALLAYLATEYDRPHRREKLAGLLWPELPERRARRNLSQTLYSLRKSLSATNPDQTSSVFAFKVEPHEIRFNASDDIWLDVITFNAGLAGCKRHTPDPDPACRHCLAGRDEALSLFQGDFLAGFSLPDCPDFDEWLLLTREQLHRQALAAAVAMAAACRRRSDLTGALRHARRAVALDPLWEPAHREVMQALWLAGQRSEALAHYIACQKTLADVLTVEPDEQTRQLARRIRADKEIVSPRPEGRSNLPHPLTPFIGRHEELLQIRACLEDPTCRLLTITGPGGSGKSRLAVEAARPMIADFPDGLFLLPLSGLGAAAALIPALVELLGVQLASGREPEAQVIDYLRARQLLIILDSCEAVPEAAVLAVSILRKTPRVKILATSRVRLNLKGETLYQLGGLALPVDGPAGAAGQADAVRLFVSSAQRVRPGFILTAAELGGIVEICRLAQGMPLAIILATAWLELLTPAKIAAAMVEDLDFLTVEWPDLPARQRSLRTTLTYTWRLLTPPQRKKMAALSVFKGGFTASAAAAVAGATKSDLLTFLNRSLLQRTAGDRYNTHDMMGQFAAEQLAAAPPLRQAVGQRHSEFYLTKAVRWTQSLQSGQQQAAVAEMDLESRNLRGAWRWALEHKAVALLEKALDGLSIYSEIRYRFQEALQGTALVGQMAGTQAETRGLRAKAQIWQARFARLSGDTAAAQTGRTAGQALIETVDAAEATTVGRRAFLHLEMGDALLHSDPKAARQWYEQSRDGYQQAGETWWLARAFAGLAEACHLVGRFEDALHYYEQSLAAFSEQGDSRGTAAAHIGLGNNCFRLGRLREGEHHLQAAINIFTSLGDDAARATGLWNLARFSWWQGNFQKGLDFQRQALPLLRDLGMRHDFGFAINGESFFSLHLGKYAQALLAAEDMLVETEKLGFPRWSAFSRFVYGEILLAQGHADTARETLAAAVEVFRGIDQLEDLASAQAIRVIAALHAGAPDQAGRNLQEALALCLETRGLWAVMHTLPATALFLAHTGRSARALAVFNLAQQYPQIAKSCFYADLVGRPLDEIARSLPDDDVIQAKESGAALDLWQTLAAVLAEVGSGEPVSR